MLNKGQLDNMFVTRDKEKETREITDNNEYNFHFLVNDKEKENIMNKEVKGTLTTSQQPTKTRVEDTPVNDDLRK
ncbi:hypothetical protein ABK040_001399 [Willaertia magna]